MSKALPVRRPQPILHTSAPSAPRRGAATAEYAVSVVAACGFGGILVALLKSDVMLNALKALINYALKLAGVEGVQL